MQTRFLLALLIVVAVAGQQALAQSQTCPNGAEADGSWSVSTGSGSDGFTASLTLSSGAPLFAWGRLDQNERYRAEFVELYEVNPGGNIVDGSQMAMDAFVWLVCTPAKNNNNQWVFDFFGVNEAQYVIHVHGTVTDQTTTDSFKWDLTLSNYLAVNQNADVVVHLTYEQTSGGSGTARDGSKKNDVVLSTSYIKTATAGSLNNKDINVAARSQDNGNTGYFLFFRTNGKFAAGANSMTVDPRMGISGSGSGGSSGGSSGGCFSADAQVRVLATDGAVVTKSVHQLRVGDKVESVDDALRTVFSDVYAVLHDGADQQLPLVELVTAAGNALRVTAQHLLLSSSSSSAWQLTEAAAVKTGDYLLVAADAHAHAQPQRVVAVRRSAGAIRAPLTLNDRIVVDGVVASVYSFSETVYRPLCLPLKLAYQYAPALLASSPVQSLVRTVVSITDKVESQSLLAASMTPISAF